MKTTDFTLIEQLKISNLEIERRKRYFKFSEEDIESLMALRELMAEKIDHIIDIFYKHIVSFSEMDRIIGDVETLERLKNYQRIYIMSLFEGQYDKDYVLSRLRIGVVHQRIGVDPKYYVSAVHHLKKILSDIVITHSKMDCQFYLKRISSIEKIIMFDLSLTFDTYINRLLEEIKESNNELEEYTESLEQVIAERTKLLKEQARHDGLTGLLNQRSFYAELKRELSRGQRKNYSTVLIYFDLDGFKKLNDTKGHKRGDEILKVVAEAMKSLIREGEIAARYGGDEFCIILPESTTSEAERLCRRFNAEIEKSTKESGISCSMGIAISLPEKNYDAHSLVELADKAMYEAKKESGFSIKIAD